MRIGIPTEVKNREFRVALTPAGVHELVARGHEVLVQAGAGLGSALPDDEFVAAGARIVGDADTVWADADLLLKVKEPVAEEYHRLRKGQVLFTYLHLAASRACTDALLGSGHHRDRLRDGPAARPVPAPARPDERGRGPARPAGRRVPPHAPRGRARRAHGRCAGRPRRGRRRDRRRRGGPERRRDRAGHGRRGHPARREHPEAPRDRRPLRRPGPHRHLERLRGGPRGDRPRTSSSAPSSSPAPARRSS